MAATSGDLTVGPRELKCLNLNYLGRINIKPCPMTRYLSLYMKNLGSEERHFLDIEVDIRQLKTEADSRLSETQTVQALPLVLPTLCFLVCAFCRPFF